MPELHGTKSAARFLGVSEASVRRWSDSGLLPVERVGRRGTRRFRESDLLRFRRRDSESRPVHERALAIDVRGVRLATHSHFPTFYDSDSGRLRLALPVMLDGLAAGDACMLVADEPLADAFVAAIDSSGVDAAAARSTGQLEIRPNIGSSVSGALAAMEDFFWRGSRVGTGVPRVVGEMVSERGGFASEADMLAYEFAVNALTKRFPSITLCQYDVRGFEGPTILGALRAHPDLFALRLGDVLL